MASVTKVSDKYPQPRGGFLPTKTFETVSFNDNVVLNPVDSNDKARRIGKVVDYLTRVVWDGNAKDAFRVAINGAKIASTILEDDEDMYMNALILATNIKGLDDKSIINAWELTECDIWYRSLRNAMIAYSHGTLNIELDQITIQNIKILVNRNMAMIEKYGPITKYGFNFDPENPSEELKKRFKENRDVIYGGYTPKVTSGDGDFLTKDTLWDIKVLSNPITSKNTLQLLMYWIMGKHSGQDIFKNINKIGIMNPRLNQAYILDVTTVSKDIIETVEKDVICY